MLAWKAWRESRGRFLLSAAALAWFCGAIVLIRPTVEFVARRPFAQAIVETIYAGSIRNIFVILVLVLGLGGLAEEAARGSAPFTLALPVSRRWLVTVRAAVGVSEVALLAFTPTIVVLALAPAVGERFSVPEAIHYSLQWAATGSLLYSLAFLLSAQLTGAYAALSAAILALTVYLAAMTLPVVRGLPSLNLFTLMDAERRAMCVSRSTSPQPRYSSALPRAQPSDRISDALVQGLGRESSPFRHCRHRHGARVYDRRGFAGSGACAVPWRPAHVVHVVRIDARTGGLVREQELGTSALTLSLPVSRLRLATVRAMVAFAELAALALTPLVVASIGSVFVPSIHAPQQMATSSMSGSSAVRR